MAVTLVCSAALNFDAVICSITTMLYCDFVMGRQEELIVLWLDLDEQFVAQAIDKVNTFFKYGILPGLVGKWHTREASAGPCVLTPSGSDVTSMIPTGIRGRQVVLLWRARRNDRL